MAGTLRSMDSGTGAEVLLGTLLGCHGAPTPDETTDGDEQGFVAVLRDLYGQRVDPEDPPDVTLGGTSIAVPDAGGFVYFYGVAPGRTPVAATAPSNGATTYGHAQVAPVGLVTSRLVPLPLAWSDEPDATIGAPVEDDGIAIEIPPAALAIDGVPAVGEWRLGWGVPGPDERETVPGDHLAQSGDVDVYPIDLHATLAVQAVEPDGDPLEMLEEQRFTVELAVPDGSPLLAGTSKVYTWAHSRAYWVETGPLAVDTEEKTVSFDAGSFGWFGLGERAGELGCVTGRITDDAGVGVSGLEVRLEQDGAVAPDRTTTVNGTFCLVAAPDTHVTLDAAGVDADRSRMFTWKGEATASGPAACGSLSCTHVGTVVAETWPDADGDQVFSGPGGDCDDADPAINPSPSLGDGGYCGGPL